MSRNEKSLSIDGLSARWALAAAILALGLASGLKAQPAPPVTAETIGEEAANAGQLEEQANLAFADDDLDQAISLYRQLASRLEGKDKVRILLTQAWVEHLTGRDVEALGTLVDALALAPETPFRAELYDDDFRDLFFEAQQRATEKRAFLVNQAARRGIENLRAGNLAAARQGFEEALRLQGDHPEAIYNLALVDLREDRNDDALAGFEKLVALAESQPGAVSPAVHALALTNLGYLYNVRDSSFEAEQVLEEAVRIDPKSASAWSNLGVARRRLGKTKPAADAFLRAYQANSDDTRVMNNLGLSYIDLKDWVAAVAILKQATDRTGDDPSLWHNFGLAQMGLGNEEGALGSFRRAVETDPGDARGWASAATIQLADYYYGKQDYPAVLAEAEKIIRWRPNLADGWTYQGLAKRATGDLNGARKSFEEARRLNPASATVHNNLGGAYFDLRLLAEAEASYEQALRIDPGFTEAQKNLNAVREMRSRGGAPPAPPPPGRATTTTRPAPPPPSPPVSRGRVGLKFSDTDYAALGLKGVLVESVDAGSAAARAGIEPRDLILEVDGRDVLGVDDFYRLVAESGRDVVMIDLLRANEPRKVELRVRP